MRKPIIGIVAKYVDIKFYGWSNNFCNNLVRYALVKNGAIPMGILPQSLKKSFNEDDEGCDKSELTQEDKDALIEQIKLCDGIVLQGGLASASYEEFIARYAIDNDIPVLGICAGQNNLIRSVGGCTKKDDNPDKHDRPDLKYAHEMTIDKDSKFYQIVKKDRMQVNSVHNYIADDTACFKTVAFSDDGHKEVVELPEKKFCIGVKFHPELLVDEDESQNAIFKALVEACKN